MKESTYKNLMNEGGEGYLPPNPNVAIFEAEMKAARAVWTPEVTQTRRAAWNAEMMTAKAEGRKINLPETEKEMGFTLADLKTAILRHKL